MIVVEFKSIKENYTKEYDGKKANTIRKIDKNDERFKSLERKEAKKIVIRAVDSKGKYTGEWFIRDITDYTIWNELGIISWTNDDFYIGNKIQEKVMEK